MRTPYLASKSERMKRRLLWFFGEFFVVVSGVLVAFLLNGWWLSIKESERERIYLKQIHDDLKSVIENVTIVSDEQQSATHATAQLSATAYMANPPVVKEVEKMIIRSLRFAPAFQIAASLSSMVSTGELALIKNDSLRMELGELVSHLSEYNSSNNHMAFSWLVPGIDKMLNDINFSDLRFQLLSEEDLAYLASDTLSGFPPVDNLKLPEPVDVYALFNDARFRADLIVLHVAQHNLNALHKSILEKVESAKLRLETEMKRKGVAF